MLALGVQVAEVGAKGKATVYKGDAPICSAVRAIFTGAIRAITRDIFFIAHFAWCAGFKFFFREHFNLPFLAGDGSRRRPYSFIAARLAPGAVYYLTAVLAADLVHAAFAAVPAVRILSVPPIPELFIITPTAPGSFQRLFMLAGIAADPQPAPAQLYFEAIELQKLFDDLAELLRAFGRLVFLVVRRVPAVFQLLEDFVMLGVDCLHRFSVAAAVGVVLHRQAAVLLLEFIKAVDVNFVYSVRLSPSGD